MLEIEGERKQGQVRKAEDRIKKHFNELRQALHEREQRLLDDVTTLKTDKLTRLKHQQMLIQQYKNNIEHAREQCKNALQ